MYVTCHKYLVTHASIAELVGCNFMLQNGVKCPTCLQISNGIKIPLVCFSSKYSILYHKQVVVRTKVLITSYLTCLDLLAAAMWSNSSAENEE